MRPERVGVIGGGAVGITAATALAEKGIDVTLYERGALASGSTGLAAGICYDAFTGERDGKHAVRSLERFRELGLLREQPYVWFVHEGDELVVEAFREQVAEMQQHGRKVTLISAAEVGGRFPAVDTTDIACAAITSNAGYVDTSAYVEAVAAQAREAGATIRTDTPVTLTGEATVETPSKSIEYDTVLVAAGPWTGELLAEAGIELALGLYRAQALVVALSGSGDEVCEPPENIPMLYDATERWYTRPVAGGVLAGNGVHRYEGDADAFDREGDDAFVDQTSRRLSRRLKRDVRVERSWAGLCTATPDRDPLLGQCGPGLYVAAGWHGHGFMRAPALGELVAAQICGEATVPAFDPDRFDGSESVDVPQEITD